VSTLNETKLEARFLMREFVTATIKAAEDAGFTPDPKLTLSDNAVALIREGLPIAIQDPRWAKLLA
jgi:hypothetical protein